MVQDVSADMEKNALVMRRMRMLANYAAKFCRDPDRGGYKSHFPALIFPFTSEIRNPRKRKIYTVILCDKILISFMELSQEGLSWQVASRETKALAL